MMMFYFMVVTNGLGAATALMYIFFCVLTGCINYKENEYVILFLGLGCFCSFLNQVHDLLLRSPKPEWELKVAMMCLWIGTIFVMHTLKKHERDEKIFHHSGS